MVRLVLFLAAMPAAAQLIPAGAPVPKTALPPVVFINGYQTYCGSTQFSDTFGKFDQFLQLTGRVSLFFDNCALQGKPAIESIGSTFGAFIAALKYTDGSAVSQVDVVTHSMGGLILRAYLAGMQTNGTFNPPVNPGIRKAIFLATPHFGTYAASIFGTDLQTQELSLGSPFVFALGTWNQGIDDMRGIDALSVEGNKGASLTGQPTGDGVSSLTSASIGFAVANRTRIAPYCHISYAALVALTGSTFLASLACQQDAPGIAVGLNATDTNVAIVLSFLNGTPDWQTLGQSPSQNTVASTLTGVILRAQNAAGQSVNFVDAAAGKTNLTLASANAVAYNELVPSGAVTMLADISGAPQLQQPATLAPGYTAAFTIKPGPSISAVIPAAALITPRIVAPGTFISIYGSALAAAAVQASSTPFPDNLGGVQVLVSGTAIPLQYVSPTQINAVFPNGLTGLVTLRVTTAAGIHIVNVMTEPVAPAIFTSDGKAAAALNAVTGAIVTATAPLHGGDYVSLFVTGLGATAPGPGLLNYAAVQPTVTIAGQLCTVQFAGLSPEFPGVDQINCQIPTALGANPAAPVIVSGNGRSSNVATLVLQ